MDLDTFAGPEPWAERQWGGTALGDARRSARAVRLGAALAARPDASLPALADTWGDLKAAYRLFSEGDVTHETLSRPHWEQTREQASRVGGVVLFVQDTTELDFTGHRRASGLGHIGDGGGAGLVLHTCLGVLHTCLGVLPASSRPEILGVAAQRVWARGQTHRGKETRTQRRERPTESAPPSPMSRPRRSRRWVRPRRALSG